MFEPGRVICGNAGVLLTRVIRVKSSASNTPFVIVDAAMNDLARPALYDAWHDFDAVAPTVRPSASQTAHHLAHAELGRAHFAHGPLGLRGRIAGGGAFTLCSTWARGLGARALGRCLHSPYFAFMSGSRLATLKLRFLA